MDHCDLAFGGWYVDLFVNERVVETRFRGFVAGIRIKDPVGSRPVDGAEAHGAGFAAGVDVTAGELEGAQAAAGIANGDHFGVGGRVVGRGHAVGATADDLSVLDDHTTERPTLVGGGTVPGERDRFLHEWVVLLFRHSQEKPVELVAGAVKIRFPRQKHPASSTVLPIFMPTIFVMDVLEQLHAARQRAEAVALCLVVQVHGSTPRAAGAKMLVYANGVVEGSIGGGELEKQVIADALRCLETRRPHFRRHDLLHQHNMCCGGSVDLYIEPIMPKERLYIFGAGHTGHALARHAVSLDFEVFVIDDRKEYLDQIHVPGVNKLQADFSAVLPSLPFDAHTYIAIMTYSHPIDRDLLSYCVKQPFAYLGMIGSERKVEMTRKLFAEGRIASPELLDRVDMPMGLDIGAETPDEIAVSVLGRMVGVRRSGGGGRR